MQCEEECGPDLNSKFRHPDLNLVGGLTVGLAFPLMDLRRLMHKHLVAW